MVPSTALRDAMATLKPWDANLRATAEPMRGPAPRMRSTSEEEVMVGFSRLGNHLVFIDVRSMIGQRMRTVGERLLLHRRSTANLMR